MNKKAQIDIEEISPIGIVGFLVGFGIAVIIAKRMDNPVVIRIITGLIVGIVCYFVGAKIAED